jgi:hypothetical protein
VLLAKLPDQIRDRRTLDLDDAPSRPHGRGRLALDARDDQVGSDQAHVETRLRAEFGRAPRRIVRGIGRGRNQREVRLAEASEHVAHDRAQLGVRLGRRGARPQLGADAVPVDAVHRLVEVRVADGRPRRVERLEPLRHLGREDGRSQRQRRHGERRQLAVSGRKPRHRRLGTGH